MERPSETVGTVSGTALDVVFVRLLQLGDQVDMPAARLLHWMPSSTPM
ncbi:MAG: hypothetical protein H6646_08480 [Anaerolineales bacterium]|nr:hypothetical protein [Anaerolineales bacterium]